MLLDFPEYFRPGYHAFFQRRFNTMARWGAAFVVSTDFVRERLHQALTRRSIAFVFHAD